LLTQVETLDVLELVLALVKPRDFVVLRMDIEGAEYEARSSAVMRGFLLKRIEGYTSSLRPHTLVASGRIH